MTTDNNDHVTATALRAIAVAQTRFHDTVTLEHVLSALLERSEVQKCLNDLNVDQAAVKKELNSFLDSVDAPKAIGTMPGRTREFDVVFARTIAYSQFSARRFPTGLDILFQILMFFEDGFASSTLRKFGLDHNKLRQYMAQGVRQPHNDYSSDTEPTDKTQATVYIKKYCSNLNELAEQGKIDPVVGRLSELDRVVQVIARRTKNNVALVGEAGVGKAQPLYSQILTSTGWKNMGDIVVGDVAITAQGKESEIVGVYPQGMKPIWQIAFEDGRKTHCCNEHLWKVYTNNWKRKKENGVTTFPYDGWRVLNTDELRHKLDTTTLRYYVPLFENGDLETTELPLDPYVLGVLLGDGCLKGKMIRLSSPDTELLDRIRSSLLEGYELSYAGRYDWRIRRTKRSKKISDYITIIDNLGLHGCIANTKFIPEDYFHSSQEQRLELLRGLLDTDGTVDGSSAVSFCSVSDQLAKDVQRLVWSLGGIAKMKERQTYYTYKGTRKAGQPSFKVAIRYREPKTLFHLQRQKDKITEDYQHADQLKNKIEEITYVGEHESQCIMLDDVEHLYITDNYVVTHNTAIVEGLAYNITKGNVPKVFRNSTVWSLDVGALVAGTRFRGDFEERMKFLLKSFSMIEDDEPILFIDELHMIMDAGSGNKGSLDISNIIKPALARGRLRCIGSTTDKDWRQHFEKDRALLRRFKKLLIDEPSIDDTKLILRGVRGLYQNFHNVRYTDEALDAAVMLTAKYVTGKLPDKAIDVIDGAGARQRVIDDQPTQVIDLAAIEQEISQIAKIPTQLLKTDEATRLLGLEKDLKALIFGQDKAINHLIKSVLISRSGLQETNKPEGSYLFVGPTGVGKSELVKQLATALGLPLTKLDMSEYTEKHSVSKLIGSPPGYVGFGDGSAGNGLLINAIDNAPASILLLDEIEKAHPDVYDILLQVMEDAVLTNSEGKSVSFRNVILIMTSNVGASKMEHGTMGFLQSPVEIDDGLLKATFSPEFRNRLDAIVEFAALDKPSMGRIVQKFIGQMQDSVRDRDIIIEITDAAKKWLTDKGFDAVHGARPLKRVIAEKIKQPLSRLILFGALRYGGVAKISVEDHDLVVNVIGNRDVTV